MTVEELLDKHGETYAHEAGIRLRNKPSPLYQLLVLSLLLSARIRAGIAITAARELFTAGWRTPRKMAEATWQQRVDALVRGGYKRYDESTATRLGDGARLLLDEWRGDLRELQPDGHDLRRFPGIGEVGADIFRREAQAVWPELRPYFDQRALASAKDLGLPTEPDELANQVAPEDVAVLAAALVRAGTSES